MKTVGRAFILVATMGIFLMAGGDKAAYAQCTACTYDTDCSGTSCSCLTPPNGSTKCCNCTSTTGCSAWYDWFDCDYTTFCQARTCKDNYSKEIRSCGGGTCGETADPYAGCGMEAPIHKSPANYTDLFMSGIGDTVRLVWDLPPDAGQYWHLCDSCSTDADGNEDDKAYWTINVLRDGVSIGATKVYQPDTHKSIRWKIYQPGDYTWRIKAHGCDGKDSPYSTTWHFNPLFGPIPTGYETQDETGEVVALDAAGRNHICNPQFTNRNVNFETTILESTGWRRLSEYGMRLVADGTTYLSALSVQITAAPETTVFPTPTPYSWIGSDCATDADCGGIAGACDRATSDLCPITNVACNLGTNCTNTCNTTTHLCRSSGTACTTNANCPVVPCPVPLGTCLAQPQPTLAPVTVIPPNPHPIPNWQTVAPGPGASYYAEPQFTEVDDTHLRLSLPIHFNETFAGSNGRVYDVQLRAVNLDGYDIYGSVDGWWSYDHQFKVWDCLVPVTGTMFDGSGVLGGPVCGTPSFGYAIPVTAQSNFTSLRYQAVAGDKTMTVSPPATYNSNTTNHLIWGNTYLPVLNADFNATAPMLRVIALGTGQTTCGLATLPVDDTVMSPYPDNVSLQSDYSTIVNQEQWFQIIGGGVAARNQVVDNVPITCPLSVGCSASITLNSAGVGKSDNGLVMAGDVNINSGCGTNCTAGNPHDWVAESAAIFDNYNYEYFYSNYYVKSGKGVYYNQGVNMSQIITDTGSTGVVFVDGDLDVDINNVIVGNQFFMVNVNGDITIDTGVDRMDGIYLSDGAVSAAGESANQLVINGMVYSSGGNVRFNRSFVNHADNNDTPSVLVNYNPAYIFIMPGELIKVLTSWKEGL